MQQKTEKGKFNILFNAHYFFLQIDFEKSTNKKLEKDLKKTLANLEDERANAARHKQVAIMLIKVFCVFFVLHHQIITIHY